MASVSTQRATLDDLYREEGKAELIGGRIVRLMASGELPSIVAGEIFVSLRLHAKTTGLGHAYPDGTGFAIVELPSGRESFSPDVAFYVGRRPVNPMRFIEGAPTFAVEVRSENDYGDAAENDVALKRVDYFAAGTLVVWDVDPLAETVAVYRHTDPILPVRYQRGEIAEAELAVPGWRMSVDDVFPS
jgi:Uma2 family endonuclease